jgi:hypothetical protein
MRYTHFAQTQADEKSPGLFRKKVFPFFLIIFVTNSILRFLLDSRAIPLPYSSHFPFYWIFPELLTLIISYFGCAWIYRKSLFQTLKASLVISTLIAIAWITPLWTTGILVLLHNFVAFIYWIQTCKTPVDRRVAVFAMTFTALITIGMFLGSFDSLLTLTHPTFFIPWAHLDSETLGRMIIPDSTDPLLWVHSVCAYAFGQMIHYFVWLKAIPDQHHYHPIPTSFRQSYRLLCTDFGAKTTNWTVLATLLPIGLCFTFPISQIRNIYFMLAAYHGYLEIAGLGHMDWKDWKRK